MIEAHKKTVERTAHYYTIGKASKQIKYFWIVCHGYGQLASRIIKKFDQFDDGETLILAPEALSSFYWQNQGKGDAQWRDRELAASWMTKNNRLDEIADYTKYIKGLLEEYKPQLADNVKVVLMGFSQGCATQVRWIMNELPEFDTLVMWAGAFPEDLDYRPHKSYFDSKSIYFLYGNEDVFLTTPRLEWHNDFTKKQGLNMELIPFIGKHEVDRVVLKKLEERIKEVAQKT